MKQFNRPSYIGLIRQWDDSTDRRQYGTKSGETQADIETYPIPGTARPALTPNDTRRGNRRGRRTVEARCLLLSEFEFASWTTTRTVEDTEA